MEPNLITYIKKNEQRRYLLGVVEGYVLVEKMEDVEIQFFKTGNNDVRDRVIQNVETGDKIPITSKYAYELVISPVDIKNEGKCVLINYDHDDKPVKQDCIKVYSFPVALDCDYHRNRNQPEKTDPDQPESKDGWNWGEVGVGGGDVLLVNNRITETGEKHIAPNYDEYTKLSVVKTGLDKLPNGWAMRLYAGKRASQRFAVYSEPLIYADPLELIMGTDKSEDGLIYKAPKVANCFKKFYKCLSRKSRKSGNNQSHPSGCYSKELDLLRDQTLYVEAHEYPTSNFDGIITLQLQLLDESEFLQDETKPRHVLAVYRVVFRVAPWLMIPNTAPVKKVFAAKVSDVESDFLSNLRTVVEKEGFEFEPIPPEIGKENRWIQDQIEIGYCESVTHNHHAVLHSPWQTKRSSFEKLQEFLKSKIQQSDIAVFKLFGLGNLNSTSLDAFGNLEVSPPVTLYENGRVKQKYPFGRIIIGGQAPRKKHKSLLRRGLKPGKAKRMRLELRRFLHAQLIQSPIEIFTGWLKVGHVDEIVCFVPFKPAAKVKSNGEEAKEFKVLLASPLKAFEVLKPWLEDDKKVMFLPQPDNKGHNMTSTSVKDFMDRLYSPGKTFWPYNLEVYQAYMNLNKEILKESLGLEEDDFIQIPVLFDVDEKDPDKATSAYFPNMVNHLVAVKPAETDETGKTGKPGETVHFIPKPWGPEISDGVYVLEEAFKKEFIDKGMSRPKTHFINEWYPLYRQNGDVHCATNALRELPTIPKAESSQPVKPPKPPIRRRKSQKPNPRWWDTKPVGEHDQ